ncbi:SixA phosphatase family protein [Caldimonas tepidiphila]|uniref:SixA phosphatase family protein n=1 Tax=Caldimonas tepidiphila TaxID=2315841 RepID=UPI000E5C1F96|nr:histidine phosphatase family protein [Caldimonas tepidiphila]
MDLILWRHAEAQMLSPDEPHGPDADLARTLTAKGERQAARMADWLNQRLPRSARVIASPARRTQQTAQALERPFETVDTIAPGASVEALLKAARWPSAPGAVLVVGHQPTLGRVAARLLTGTEQPWSVRKASVWWLRRRLREGQPQVLLMAVHSLELF